MMVETPDTKICSKCKEPREVVDFYKNKRYKDGLDCWCKECRRAYARAYIPPKTKDTDPDSPLERRRKYFRERQRIFRTKRKTND